MIRARPAADAAHVQRLLRIGHALAVALDAIEVSVAVALDLEPGPLADVITDAIQVGWSLEQFCLQLDVRLEA